MHSEIAFLANINWLAGYLEWLASEFYAAFSELLNLKKRVSVAYLATGTFFAFVLFYWRYGRGAYGKLKPLFNVGLWTNKSARADYGIWLLNRVLFAPLYPMIISKVAIISWLMYQLRNIGLDGISLGLPTYVVIGLFSISYFLLDDFSRFYIHRLMHRWPLLWQFHKVHHSATELTPFTVLRTHPIEGLLFYCRSLVVQSLLVSVFIVLFPGQVSLFTVMGVFVSTFLFNLLGSNLRHSPIPLSYGKKAEKWLLSPAQHQLHHSIDRRHYDCNFGVVLAIWDRLFCSWLAGSDTQRVRYGTGTKFDESGVFLLYASPFLFIYETLKEKWLKSAIWRANRNFLQKSKK